jgi:hypothetical protein
MHVDESDFLEHFFSSFTRLPCGISAPSGAVTVSSRPSYFPDCEFDFKNEGGFILRTSPLTS